MNVYSTLFSSKPELLQEVLLLFDQPPPGECFAAASSRRRERDRHEVRTLTASAVLADLGWVGAQQVLRLESCVTHIVRHVTLGEDASQVRSGTAPQALAALHNAVLSLLRHHHYDNIAAALRHFAWAPGAALHLLGLSPPQ